LEKPIDKIQWSRYFCGLGNTGPSCSDKPRRPEMMNNERQNVAVMFAEVGSEVKYRDIYDSNIKLILPF